MNERPTSLGPDFSMPVQKDGYAWWYVDAVSDCGAYGLTVIAFVGSVFSPYYFRARQRGDGDPENHSALNVALYGKGGKRWALTERGRGDISRSATRFEVGPSSVDWDGVSLTIKVDEISCPVPRRLKGTVTITPSLLLQNRFTLSETGRHVWQPIAPVARAEVRMEHPARSWSGHAYFDHNRGDRPLEADFKGWTWSRVHRSDGATIFYDCERRDQSHFGLSLEIGADGRIASGATPPPHMLPPTPVWRFPRWTRADPERGARVLTTCEDTPFYSRSICALTLGGVERVAMHESLSLERFASPWMQAMLPFRMPRIAKP